MIPKTMLDRITTTLAEKSETVFRGTLVTMVVLAFVIPLALVSLPFIEFFNGMAAQPKGKAQMTYGRVYGETLLVERKPVEGSVHRDWKPYLFEDRANNLEAAREVGKLLENPFPVTLESMQRGQELFDIFCMTCHGKTANGDGPITGPEKFPAPPSLHTEQAVAYPDGTIYHIITRGTEKMPGYAELVDPDDRWHVIHYVRALQRAGNPLPEDLEE